VVVRLPTDFGEERAEGETLLLSAGAPIGRLAARGHALGLVGAEFSAGIPGTLGGATAMNAGTRLGEMSGLLTRVELATAEGLGFVPAAALRLAYRHCELPAGAVVTRVELRLRPGDVAASRAAMEADVAHRRATQPLHQPSFGSTFWNPPGRFAGQLIEAAGLKGHRVGGAMYSPVHANFIVNLGEATARDVLSLIRLARVRVEERFGVRLETEVRLLGRFDPGEV
jgi:UDP-N-acetylmuramate dehydrogenase